ncbi:helix-turn-helix transcriptional regulator [Dactylosporangium sp. NPDC051485]|uniref:helix-turn-helix domain-containing protein n=1 Tax=Dactylosporangium sp. NPDC051485 TaxID=3154846 RepID=UPI0034152624
MSDTGGSGRRSSHDQVILNNALFCARADELGARNDHERCTVAGVSRASLYRWRAGTVMPSLRVLRRVAARLGVRPDDLLCEVPR